MAQHLNQALGPNCINPVINNEPVLVPVTSKEKMMSENTEKSVPNNDKGFISKLSNGDFGLAKTYWLYGVVVGFVVQLVMKSITSIGLLLIVMLAYTAYEIPVIIGTWHAADKYKGPKVWAILAKIATVVGAIMLAVGLFAVVGILG